MQTTFYFYDLETTSGRPRDGRIMQFAGQRTDELLQPIGEPDNILLALSDDVIPEPDAILVHGITPQQCQAEGLSEYEFMAYFQERIATPGTIFVGYNNIRFDDEFIRRVCYRTFYDPYQWHWKDGRSRWDLLDPIRMMRALRPDGLLWPVLDGKPTVKLELMAKENGLLHESAHDALSDVVALIQLAQKYREAQPRLFSYLVDHRDKKEVAKVVLGGEPFVYTSGKYSSDFEKTSIVYTLAKHPRRDAAIVYDLRQDPTSMIGCSVAELVTRWTAWNDDTITPLPLKIMQFNRCPTIAPVSVIDTPTKQRLALDMDVIARHRAMLDDVPECRERIMQALDVIENEQQTRLALDDHVDDQMYAGFWGDTDQESMYKIRHATPDELTVLATEISQPRIRDMVPLYKARNFYSRLTPEEVETWDSYRKELFFKGGDKSRIPKFYARLAQLSEKKLTSEQSYLLTELQLYVESILPVEAE